MRTNRTLNLMASLVFFAMVTPALATWYLPQQAVPGIYAGLFFKADGVKLQDTTLPWLKLNPDGTYQWGGENGTYKIHSSGVDFSGVHASWGAGKMESDGEIYFEFIKEGKRYTVKMFRVAVVN